MAYVPERESPNKKAGLSKHTAVSVSLLHTHTHPQRWEILTALRFMW